MAGRIEPLRLVHHHPGRLRVRANCFRDGDDRVNLVRRALEGHPAIRALGHNPSTGSLVIEYTPGRTEPDALLGLVAEAAGLDGVVDEASLPRDELDVRAVVRGVRKLNAITRELTGGRADLTTLVPAALASSAVYWFFRAPVAPRWDNLLYWSYVIFKDLNSNAIAAEVETTPPGHVVRQP